MNQGLNNPFNLPQQAQIEQFQQLIRQQSLLPMLSNSTEILQNLSRMPGYNELFLNTLSQGSHDLFSQYTLLNQSKTQPTNPTLPYDIQYCQSYIIGLQDQNNPINYQTLLKSQLNFSNLMSPQYMFGSFPYNQLNLLNRQSNNQSNPICVDDDEPVKQIRKCHNQQCTGKGERKVKSKKNEYLYYCDKCLRLFNKGNYCDYCEQVYSNGSYDQDEVGWIQCDGCEKWNHIGCEQKYRNPNIQNEPEDIPYYCISCFKPKKQQIINKTEEQPQQKEYKTRIPIDPENYDGRSRERNITFIATKDNKVQFTFRFNLYEEEIKTDLESLRNTTNPNPIVKKIKKLPSPVQSKFNSAIVSEEKNSEQNVTNTRLRTRKQKYKVNYRDLGGEQ